MTKNPTVTSVSALKNALKKVIEASGAKTASLTVDQNGMLVEAATGAGYASVQVPITGIPGDPCKAEIGANLVNVILTSDDADKEIKVLADDRGARLKYAGANLLLKLPTTSIEDLFAKTFLSKKAVPIVTLTGAQIAAAVTGATRFMAKSDLRYYFNGIHVHVVDGKLRVQGTDGFSLQKSSTDHIVGELAKDLNMIIPYHAASALVGVFDADEVVKIEMIGDQSVGFTSSSFSWIANLISHAYPDTTSLFSGEANASASGLSVVVNRKSVLSALNRVRSVAEKEGHYLYLDFTCDNMRVRSTDDEQRDELPLHAITIKESMQASVTSSVFINAIEAVPAEFVKITKGPNVADKIFLSPYKRDGDAYSEADPAWKAIVMPARV